MICCFENQLSAIYNVAAMQSSSINLGLQFVWNIGYTE